MTISKKKIVITAGGTGGHIFPAVAIAESLAADRLNHDLLFIGGGLAKNSFFARHPYPFKDISCSPFHVRNPFKAPMTLWRIAKGIIQSIIHLRKFKPDLVIGFGSYHTFPVLYAASMLNYPIVLHEANAIPGKVIRFFSKKSKITGLHFAEAAKYLQGNIAHVGMPIKKNLLQNVTKEEARKYYGLNPKVPTILIFGGSQGASALNQWLPECFLELKRPFQIIHLSGNDIETELLKDFYDKYSIKSAVKTFEDRMHYAWQAADFIISRSGAGTIAEMVHFQKTGMLIPYPWAADNHQTRNAEVLSGRGAAVLIPEKCLHLDELIIEWLHRLMSNEIVPLKKALKRIKETKTQTDFYSLIKGILYHN